MRGSSITSTVEVEARYLSKGDRVAIHSARRKQPRIARITRADTNADGTVTLQTTIGAFTVRATQRLDAVSEY